MFINHSCSHWTASGCLVVPGPLYQGRMSTFCWITGSFMSIHHGVLSSDLHVGVPVSLGGPVYILLGAPVQRLLCVTACWSWPNLADVHPSASSAAASQQPALHGSHTHQNTCSCLMRKCVMLDVRGCVLSLSCFGPCCPLSPMSSSLLVRSATIHYCLWEERRLRPVHNMDIEMSNLIWNETGGLPFWSWEATSIIASLFWCSHDTG